VTLRKTGNGKPSTGLDLKKLKSTLKIANFDGLFKVNSGLVKTISSISLDNIMIDTKNSLVDFDMCLALAQRAINSQMTAAWATWITRSEFSTTGEMKDFALVSVYDNDFQTSGLEVEFDPLSVSLSVPNGKLGQVQVTLYLKSGTVFSEKTDFTRGERRAIDGEVEDMIAEAIAKGLLSPKDKDSDAVFDEYTAKYKKENPEKFRNGVAIANWSVSFLTDLDKKPCDLNLLAQIDPQAHEAASKCIQDSGLPDSVFSIEYLFMKFTEVDLLLSDNKDINIPADVPKATSERARSCLNTLLQGGNGEFMMGTVVRRSKTHSEGALPTFALTDFIFSVKADAVPEASTLSYLGMFSRRALPPNLDTARIALQDNWVRPEMLDGTRGSISGTMAISKERFVNQYVIPLVANKLQVSPTRAASQMAWTFASASQQRSSTRDIIDRKWDRGANWSIDITISPGTSQLDVSGRISSYAHMDGYTLKLGALGGYHTEWIYIGGHRNFSSRLLLTGGGSGSTFDLEPKLGPLNFTAMQVDRDEIKGGAVVLNAFEELTGSTTAERLGNQQSSLVDNLKQQLEASLGQVQMDLSQQSFIPPGAGVFTFQNPRFSMAGDLLFDVIYQAP
jgi:hypothetical protein